MSQSVNHTGAGAGGDIVLIALGGVVLGSAGIVWGGAWLAALLGGGTLSGGVSDAVGAMGPLASSPGDPATAWGDAAEGLPGPVLYWVCTALFAVAVVGLAAGVFWLWRRWSAPPRVAGACPPRRASLTGGMWRRSLCRRRFRRQVASCSDGSRSEVHSWRPRTASDTRCMVAVALRSRAIAARWR